MCLFCVSAFAKDFDVVYSGPDDDVSVISAEFTAPDLEIRASSCFSWTNSSIAMPRPKAWMVSMGLTEDLEATQPQEIAKLFYGYSTPRQITVEFSGVSRCRGPDDACEFGQMGPDWRFRTSGMDYAGLNCRVLFDEGRSIATVYVRDFSMSRFMVDLYRIEASSVQDCHASLTDTVDQYAVFSPGEELPCSIFTLNDTSPEWLAFYVPCSRRLLGELATVSGADISSANLKERCLIAHLKGAERPANGEERSLSFYREFLVPAINRVVFSAARVPFRRIQANPKEKGVTVLGGTVAPANVFSCVAIQEVPVGSGGGEGPMWKHCEKKELKLPTLWERAVYRRDSTSKLWFSTLRKDRNAAMADVYQWDARTPQNARLFRVSAPDVMWSKGEINSDYCPVVLLEKDCHITCLSLCEVALKHDIPVLTVAMDVYLLASNMTRKGMGYESAVRHFPGKMPQKAEKKKCPSGKDVESYVSSPPFCRKGTQVELRWNAIASFIGLKSEEAWRANAGEARELTWVEAFSECSLATYFLMAFTFPLFVEGAFGWQRGSRPAFCLGASLILMALARFAVPFSPLPFSAGWNLVFIPILIAVTRENCRSSPSVIETVMTILAVGAAGVSRSADNGWMILAAQCATSLFLSLGAASSTSLSMSAVISLALFWQNSEYDATLLHRLTSAPADFYVLYLAWSSYSDTELDELVDLQGEGLLTFYLISTILSLFARYSLLVSFLSFALPTSPWILDKSGRVKKAVFTALFSSLKAETAQSPARVTILLIVFGVGNPVLVFLLALLVLNASDDAVTQITQATYQALVDQITAIQSTTTTAKPGGISDALTSAFESQPLTVQRASFRDIVGSGKQSEVNTAMAHRNLTKMVTARLLKDAGVDSKYVDSFHSLSESRKWSVIIRNSGHALAHVTCQGGFYCMPWHCITGPTGELGPAGVGEKMILVTDGEIHGLQVDRVPDLVTVAPGMTDAIFVFGAAAPGDKKHSLGSS